MTKYFNSSTTGDKQYFSEPKTTSQPACASGIAMSRHPASEPKAAFERSIAAYAVKKSGVVHRRYGIK